MASEPSAGDVITKSYSYRLSWAQVTLPNGLRVFLAEDHELPLVRGTLLMRGGQRAAPADKVGEGA